MSFSSVSRLSTLALLVLAGCATTEPTASDEAPLSALSPEEILGAIEPGTTSSPIAYANAPRYRALAFLGAAGDLVDLWVKSQDGDAVAFLADATFKSVTSNDDASASTHDAHLIARLPADGRYYVVFRERDLEPATFTVSFDKTSGPLEPAVAIELLVDQSASMNSGEKWTATRDALLATFDAMRTSASARRTYVGVRLFPSSSSTSEVHPGPIGDRAHHDELVELVDIPRAEGAATPTFDGLTQAYRTIERFKLPTDLAFRPLKRVVVLVSDGVPNGGATEVTRCLALAAEKLAAPAPAAAIRTFAINLPGSFGATTATPFMSRLAHAGGTGAAGCDPEATEPSLLCHYQIDLTSAATGTAGIGSALTIIRARTETGL